MGMTSDLTQEVNQIIRTDWKERDGTKVPEPEDVKLGNDAVKLDGTVLYADLAESTQLVNKFAPWFAAEVYKSYLVCACRIIRDRGGVITAFDGDRVMAVFIGNSKNTSAVRAALAINHAVSKIINPLIHAYRPSDANVQGWTLRHAVGVDTSPLFVARTGIRGSNDLVWVGRSANHAAKLCSIRDASLFITSEVYDNMDKSVKYADDGRSMWTSFPWSQTGKTAYKSNWDWGLG